MSLETGKIYEGKVRNIAAYGAFVEINVEGKVHVGMVHISEVSSSFINDINEVLKEGQNVKVKVLSIADNGKIALSIKKAAAPVKRAPKAPAPPVKRPEGEWQPKKNDCSNFEEMMARFKQVSDEKLSDLKRINDDRRGNHRK